MSESHLYFILNPVLGIIKIGIADNVPSRRQALECGCGISLDVLCVVRNGAPYEKRLHLAFTPTRLLGEWFTPSPELLELVDHPETIPAFLERMAPQMREWADARAAANERQREESKETGRIERERLAELKREAKRVEQERKAKAARLREAREEKKRERIEAERVAWATRHPDLKSRLVRNDLEREAWERRANVENQRVRNAAMLGVAPEGA